MAKCFFSGLQPFYFLFSEKIVKRAKALTNNILHFLNPRPKGRGNWKVGAIDFHKIKKCNSMLPAF